MEAVALIVIMVIAFVIGARQQARKNARRHREDAARLDAYQRGDLPRTRYEARQIHRAQARH